MPGRCAVAISLAMPDFARARLNMVESQIRTNKVTDPAVLAAFSEVPREAFVDPALRGVAYIDEDLPLKPGRFLIEPMVVARMIQALDVQPTDLVLDVGCATGYSTAVLARLAKRVVAVECDKNLAAQARELLQEAGAANAIVVEGRLGAGVPDEGPFDAILLNGAVTTIEPGLLEQLKEGGRLTAVVTEGPVCRASVWRRVGKSFDARSAFEAGAAALPGFESPAGFVF